jgi:hypothetical protein
VDAHPDAQLDAVRPGVRGDALLSRKARGHGRRRVVERNEERIAVRVDLVAAVRRPGGAQDPVVVGEQRVVAVVPERASVDIVGFSDAGVELVERGVGLFREAGLELPPLQVRRSESEEVCRDQIAFHLASAEGSQIVLCYPLVAGREWRVLLHELGHAWASVGLTDERRADFRELRGYEHWRDYDRAEWGDNGTEQAAEVLKWGVSDVPVPVFIDRDSCPELRAAYQALTGTEPLHDRSDDCG